MRIVVDTNIVFSAILNTSGEIADVLITPKTKFNFYSTEQLALEINFHKAKLRSLSGYSDEELNILMNHFSSRINIVSLKQIPKKHFYMATKLTKDIDQDDLEFIALT